MKIVNNWVVLLIILLLELRLRAASTIQFTQAVAYTVAENAGTVSLPVQRIDDLNTIVSVDYATIDGTALAGLKYTSVSGTLTFATGETNKTIVVPILNDGVVGGVQDFQVILSNPTSGTILDVQSNASVRITDNDKGLQFEFGSYSVAEDAGVVLIGVLRRDDGNFPVTVEYATADGTAKSGVDYSGVTNTLSFAAGEMVKLFTVPILNDAIKESSRSFRLELSHPTGGGVLGAPKTVTATILDNDPGVQFEFSNYWVGENEGSVTVNVQRGRDADTEPFTVDYATTSATAVAGQDYVETRGTLTFAAGETVHPITVPILGNESSPSDRQFKLTLSNPSTGAALGTNRTATATVLDTTGAQPHSIRGITVQPDHSVLLNFEGGVNKRFKDYFDLYPLEVSTDLRTWVPWTTLQRTNASTSALTYTIPSQAAADRMFFRTPAGPLITPYRQPTGPFPVGFITRLITDPSRRNRYGVSTNGSFMISVWYPATRSTGKLSPLVDPWDFSNAGAGTAFRSRTRSFFTHALEGVPCDAEKAPYPIVIHSHGYALYRSAVSETAPNLASHGYVVVAADHVDASGTIFPDGVLHAPDSDFTPNDVPFIFQDRVADIKCVFNQLEQWNQSDTLFLHRLDLTRMATMGHSFGGGVAAEMARIDRRVRAAILLDAYNLEGSPELLQNGLAKPVLGMHSTLGGGDSALYAHPSVGTYIRFTINPSLHEHFSDPFSAIYENESLNTLSDWREASRTINAWALWFLNKHLKGLDEPMPALKDYPRITGFKQK